MSRPKFAFDADDLTFPFTMMVTDYFNELYGTNYRWHDLPTLTFSDIWPVSYEACNGHINRIMAEDGHLHREAKPFEETIEVIKRLSAWADLGVLTARDDALLSKQTHAWFAHWFGDAFGEIILLSNPYVGPDWRHKAEVCLERGYLALTDDSLPTLLRAHTMGVHAIRYGNYGWNRHCDAAGREIPLPEGMDDAADMLAVEQILVKRYHPTS